MTTGIQRCEAEIKPGEGRVMHIIGDPRHMPAVDAADLLAAWETASAAAQADLPLSDCHIRALYFHDDGNAVRLVIKDDDAAYWAGALNAAIGLDNAHHLAICLRLLGLVHLLGETAALRPLFDIDHSGVDFHPALLDAAASAPLTADGRLDPQAINESLAPLLKRMQRRRKPKPNGEP